MKPITCSCGRMHYLTEAELTGAAMCTCGKSITEVLWDAAWKEGEKTQRRYALPEPAVPISFLQPVWDLITGMRKRLLPGLTRPAPPKPPEARFIPESLAAPRPGHHVVQTPDGKFLQDGHPITVVRDIADATHYPEDEAQKLGKRFFGAQYRQKMLVEDTNAPS